MHMLSCACYPRWNNPRTNPMNNGYGQFCPIAKAAEIFATRWTPLILRELLSGAQSFGDIQRGVPLMSRALLAERLRQMEHDGLITKQLQGRGHEYRLTKAGEAFRRIVAALGEWGMTFTREHVSATDLDPGLLLWALRIRCKTEELPEQRVVVRFEFSGVPANRTKFRIMWLVLDGETIDVCAKDPGHEVDLIVRAQLRTFVDVFLGNVSWQEGLRRNIAIEGASRLATALPHWFQLDKMLGSDLPFVHYTTTSVPR